MKERKRPKEQSEKAREQRETEVERERFVTIAIPERFSCVRLDWKLALHSSYFENSVVDHK